MHNENVLLFLNFTIPRIIFIFDNSQLENTDHGKAILDKV